MAGFNLGVPHWQSRPFGLCKPIPQFFTIWNWRGENRITFLIKQAKPHDLGRCWDASLEHLQDVFSRFMSYKPAFQLFRNAVWFIKVDESLIQGIYFLTGGFCSLQVMVLCFKTIWWRLCYISQGRKALSRWAENHPKILSVSIRLWTSPR